MPQVVDHYSLVARVAPMLLVASPVAMLTWGLVGSDLWSTVATLIGGPLIFSVLLAELGRDLGRRRQDDLWRSWDGAPTTRLLRHRDPALPVETKARYHAALSQLIGSSLPSSLDETQDPSTADRIYETCTTELIGRTRSREAFPLLYKENVSYGFRRNLWGLRWIGMGVSLTAMAVSSGLAIAALPLAPRLWLVFSGSGAMTIFWIAVVRPDWVRIPAEAYAHRLLEVCTIVSEASKKTEKTDTE